MDIQLNTAERQLAIFLATSRYENARKKNKPNKRMGDQPDWITDLDGIGGEIVVCKYMNCYPDTEVDLEDLPEYDLISPKGSRVDVKTTKYKNGKLLATLNKKVDAVDIYVLVIGQFPDYNLAGWCFSQELIRDENIIDLGHGKGYALDQDNLRSFEK